MLYKRQAHVSLGFPVLTVGTSLQYNSQNSFCQPGKPRNDLRVPVKLGESRILHQLSQGWEGIGHEILAEK